MPQILIRPQAQHDLDAIGDYIAERGGDDRADQMLDRIEQVLQHAAAYPFTGRARDELRPGLRSLPIRPYVIYYFPLADGIRVARILHGARDSVSIFEGEDDSGE